MSPKAVGTDWRFRQIFPGGRGVIYAVADNKDLLWYRHLGRTDGTGNWQGPRKVGNGWSFDEVFSGGNG